MYSRNTGSNWPSSGRLITASTRGSALIGPGPISRRSGGSTRLIIWMLLQPVLRDVDTAGDPDLLASHVLEEALERGESAGPADQPAVQADRHHAAFLGIQDVEAVLEVVEEVVARVEALRGGEAHVVRVERVGHDELRFSVARVVPRQVVV